MLDLGAAGNLTLILKLNGKPDKGSSMKTLLATPPDLRGKWLLWIDDPGRLPPEPQLHVVFAGTQNRGKLKVIVDPDDPELRNWLGSSGEYRVSSDLVVMKIAVRDELYYFNGSIDSSDFISGNYSYDSGAPLRRRHGPWTANRIK